MICIFSSTIDMSTADVTRWLHHLGETDVLFFCADHHSDDTISVNLNEDDLIVQFGDRRAMLSEIGATWYRKGGNWLSGQFFYTDFEGHEQLTQHVNRKIANEQRVLLEYLHALLEERVPALGSAARAELNKLVVLRTARALGLRTPDFHVINRKADLLRLLEISPGWITKSLSDGIYLFDRKTLGRGYFSYTEKLDAARVAELPEVFTPSLVQEQIEKQYELRVFYLDRRCYAMAIFSQRDQQTAVDFRKYNEEKPNRFVPYQLPEDIETKLGQLFRALGLNTGSADILVDRNGDSVFLEINPVGQFSMVSAPCNYYLEKEVASTLIRYAQP